MYCFSNFCFVCLNTADNLQSLTTTDTDQVQFLDKFKYCNFENEIADDPTSSMCYSCLESMKTAYQFKKMCENSNSVFIKYLELDELKSSETVKNISLKTIQQFVQMQKIKMEPDYTSEEELVIEDVSSLFDSLQNELLSSRKTNSDKSSLCKVSKRNIKYELVSPNDNEFEDVSSLLPTSINSEQPYSLTSLSDSSKPNKVITRESSRTSPRLRIKTDLLHSVLKISTSLPDNVSSNEDPLGLSSLNNESATPKWIEFTSAGSERIFVKEKIVESAEDGFKCIYCKKVFSRKICLRNHLLTHSEAQKNHCSICKKNFSLKSNLKTHMLIHTGTRPHKCDECGKCFSHRSNLYTHRLVHTGEKKHQCTICCKSFTKKSNYKTHMIIHTEERPHSCKECSKSFRLKSHLKRHMITH